MIFFKAITSLKVNIGKSELVPVGVIGSLNTLSSVLSCNVGKLPMTYLDMPLGAHFKDPSIWNPIIEKWRRSFLVGNVYICQKGKINFTEKYPFKPSHLFLILVFYPSSCGR